MRPPRTAQIFLLACAHVTGLASSVTSAAPGSEPRGRSWIDQVGRDRDRGAGRIVDDATWETQRLQERRDVRLGRLRPRRGFERFDEERDRELQIEAAARRNDRAAPRGLGTSDPAASAILSRPPTSGGGAGLPSLAAVVARDQRELAAARETLERSLRGVDAAEARELRLLRRRLNREGRANRYEAEREQVQGRYNGVRADHQREYEKVRSRITGRRARH
jgi:hypothetical protein